MQYLDPVAEGYALKQSVPEALLSRYNTMVTSEDLDVAEIADAFLEMMDQVDGVMRPPVDQTVEQRVYELFDELFDLGGDLTIHDIFAKTEDEAEEEDAYKDDGEKR